MTTSTNTTATCAPHSNATRTPLWSLLRQSIAMRRERAQLAKLDNTVLCDLGLTRTQALAEAKRPIWDVPAHWRR